MLTAEKRSNRLVDIDGFYASIGRNIREARQVFNNIGMTQEELAERLELTRTSVTNIEKGTQRVPLHKLIEISRTLQIELDELLPELRPTSMESDPLDGLPSEEGEWIKAVITADS